MLTGIDPLLTGEILKVLDEMGHSDALVIADANFPAHRTATRVIEVPGVDIVSMLRAVRTVFPLDEDHPPALMDSGLTPTPKVQTEILEAVDAADHVMFDRWKYYELTNDAYAVISTGELRLWANVVLYKGLPHFETE